MSRVVIVLLGVIVLSAGCSTLMPTPKQDIVLLVDPETINYKCFQTNTDIITCRRISE